MECLADVSSLVTRSPLQHLLDGIRHSAGKCCLCPDARSKLSHSGVRVWSWSPLAIDVFKVTVLCDCAAFHLLRSRTSRTYNCSLLCTYNGFLTLPHAMNQPCQHPAGRRASGGPLDCCLSRLNACWCCWSLLVITTTCRCAQSILLRSKASFTES